jgi:putative SOS response-associated peptidase YedK
MYSSRPFAFVLTKPLGCSGLLDATTSRPTSQYSLSDTIPKRESGAWIFSYWSKDGKTGLINALAERIDTAPAFRRPFYKRRCFIRAKGFYELKKTPERKIPYSIEM